MNADKNPYALAAANKKLLTLAGIYIAALITRFISTGTFTVLPMAALDIGGMDIYPLASTISGPVSIIAMPVYGYIGSRNPAFKRYLLLGSLLVGVAVLLAISLAPSMLVIIAVNLFYGIVSASIFVVAFSIIRDMYDVKQAGIYLGFIGTVTSIGMLIGPALAGLIIDNLGWRYFYHVGWALLLAAVVVIFFGVKVSRTEAPVGATPAGNAARMFDLPGAIALSLFLLGLVVALSFGRSDVLGSALAFGHPANFALLAIALASLAALVLIVRRKRERAFIPSTVFGDRNTMVLALCNLLSNFSTMSISFFMPSYIINVLGGSALQAGLATAVYAVLGIFICPFLGRAIARARNARWVLTAGTLVRIAIQGAFVFLLSASTPLLLVYVLMFIAGFYSAQQNSTFSTAPQVQIPEALRFQGNSVVQTAQNLGSTIGIAVYTMVMATFGIAEGLPAACIISALTGVVLLAAAQLLKKGQSV
ncbi:MAG: MFS transporter [Coriobacteriales bacterium]|jgi:MFS family permease|nr:MFS transporter [Coriobacteriales bacterium]